MKRATHIDLTQIERDGLHGMKIDGKVVQMLFADPADATLFAQRLLPVREGDHVAIVPVEVVERRKPKMKETKR
jgi:hypothetical protein